jgi:hypothetical protein
VLIFYDMCSLWAEIKTCSATDAFILIEKKLRAAFLRFGIVTPGTTQGTSLKKDGRTNAGTVVHTKALDLGDS